MVSSWII